MSPKRKRRGDRLRPVGRLETAETVGELSRFVNRNGGIVRVRCGGGYRIIRKSAEY